MTKVNPIPDGYHSVTPYLIIKGASDAIEFYKKAFGAQETERFMTPDGKASLDVALPARTRKMHPALRFLRNTNYWRSIQARQIFAAPPGKAKPYGSCRRQAPRPCVAAYRIRALESIVSP